MNFEVGLISGKIIFKFTYNSKDTITDLLHYIEDEYNQSLDTVFDVIYNTTILNWQDKSKLYNFFLYKQE